jgi:hypothetical protein
VPAFQFLAWPLSDRQPVLQPPSGSEENAGAAPEEITCSGTTEIIGGIVLRYALRRLWHRSTTAAVSSRTGTETMIVAGRTALTRVPSSLLEGFKCVVGCADARWRGLSGNSV